MGSCLRDGRRRVAPVLRLVGGAGAAAALAGRTRGGRSAGGLDRLCPVRHGTDCLLLLGRRPDVLVALVPGARPRLGNAAPGRRCARVARRTLGGGRGRGTADPLLLRVRLGCRGGLALAHPWLTAPAESAGARRTHAAARAAVVSASP